MTPCAGCGSPLADDQRYCLQCGARRGPLRIPGPPPAATPAVVAAARTRGLPSRASAGAISMAVLAGGVLIGVAVGPLGGGESLAAARTIVVMQPASDGFGPAPGDAVELATPSGEVADEEPVEAEPEPEPEAPEESAPEEPETEPAAPEDDTPAGGEEPPTMPTTKVVGIVAHVNPRTGSYALASPEGQLITVYAKRLPALGQKRSTELKPRDDGTFDEDSAKGKGRADAVKIAGIVTFSDAATRVYVVSVPGASILVHSPVPVAGGPVVAPPLVGDMVTTTAAIVAVPPPVPAPGTPPPDPATPPPAPTSELRETALATQGKATGPIDIEAVVKAVDPVAGTVTLTADDVGESGREIVVKPEPGVRIDALKPDQPVGAEIRFAPDGTATLVKIAARKQLPPAAPQTPPVPAE